MPENIIKKIKLPTGTEYSLVDQGARDLIDEMSGYTDFLGVTTTALTDGATTNPITINGASVTAKKGNIVTYGSAEFIFNGTAWQLFGDLSGLGDLAFKDTASGTVAVPKTYTTTVTPSTTSKYVASSATGGGSASKSTVTVSKASSGTATYTPEGTVSKPTFTGTEGTVSVSGALPNTVILTPSSTGTMGADITPAGTVSTPTITVTPSTTTVNSITAVGSLPSWTATVDNEVLTIGWSAGTLPTKGSNTTVATGIQSATSSQPTFSGTTKRLTAGIGTATKTLTGTFTPEGDVSQPTFSGTGARLKTDSEVYTSVTMPSFSSQTIATGISSASTTTATTENKTVTVS